MRLVAALAISTRRPVPEVLQMLEDDEAMFLTVLDLMEERSKP